MVRPERFELPTYWFVASRSIQLSYGRVIGFKQNHRQNIRVLRAAQLPHFRQQAPAAEPVARQSMAILRRYSSLLGALN